MALFGAHCELHWGVCNPLNNLQYCLILPSQSVLLNHNHNPNRNLFVRARCHWLRFALHSSRIFVAHRLYVAHHTLNAVSAKSHILVVDDSGFARRTLRQMLESDGHSCDEAQNGTEALERYASRRPDIVLLDMVMEEMNGLEVLANLRRVDPEAKVLVVSADIQTSTSQQAKAAGANGMLNKPFQKDQLLATVAKVASGDSAWS